MMLPTDAGGVSEKFHTPSQKAQGLKLEGPSSIWKSLCRTHSQPYANGETPNVFPLAPSQHCMGKFQPIKEKE